MGIIQRAVQERSGEKNPPNKWPIQDVVKVPKLYPDGDNRFGMGIRRGASYEHGLSTFFKVIPGVIPNYPHLGPYYPQALLGIHAPFAFLVRRSPIGSRVNRKCSVSRRSVSLW